MNGVLLSIHEYAGTGDWAGVLAHLERGASIDERDPRSGRTPLMEAVANPHTRAEFVRLLIAKGADVNAGARDLPVGFTEEQIENLESMLEGPDSKLAQKPDAQEIRDILKSQ